VFTGCLSDAITVEFQLIDTLLWRCRWIFRCTIYTQPWWQRRRFINALCSIWRQWVCWGLFIR
jgi:hypothetical protein